MALIAQYYYYGRYYEGGCLKPEYASKASNSGSSAPSERTPLLNGTNGSHPPGPPVAHARASPHITQEELAGERSQGGSGAATPAAAVAAANHELALASASAVSLSGEHGAHPSGTVGPADDDPASWKVEAIRYTLALALVALTGVAAWYFNGAGHRRVVHPHPPHTGTAGDGHKQLAEAVGTAVGALRKSHHETDPIKTPPTPGDEPHAGGGGGWKWDAQIFGWASAVLYREFSAFVLSTRQSLRPACEL